MLLENIINVKVSNRTKKYFIDKGYVEKNEFFHVHPEDMNDTNRTKVLCKCDYCGLINNITWSNYIVQINKSVENIYSCHKCHFNKTRIKFVEKYGVENIQNLDKIRNKIKKTCIEKYGVSNAFKSVVVKDKIKKTMLERYGVDHPMKNLEIFNRAQKNSYRTIKYKHSELYYKGTYELDFIEFCIKNEINIENGPTIKYFLNLKDRRYFSDFYLPEYNLIIEVKSTYTFNDDYEENLTKKEFSIKSGYNFIFIIDKDYSELNYILGIT
jgi:hypothetical protein